MSVKHGASICRGRQWKIDSLRYLKRGLGKDPLSKIFQKSRSRGTEKTRTTGMRKGNPSLSLLFDVPQFNQMDCDSSQNAHRTASLSRVYYSSFDSYSFSRKQLFRFSMFGFSISMPLPQCSSQSSPSGEFSMLCYIFGFVFPQINRDHFSEQLSTS